MELNTGFPRIKKPGQMMASSMIKDDEIHVLHSRFLYKN
jgi:hypothetical protein